MASQPTQVSQQRCPKVYGSGKNQVVALDDVSFSVEKGEFVSIVGPSGSGKSTLLHILGGVDQPTGGKVFLDGTDLHSLREDGSAASSAGGRSGWCISFTTCCLC